VVAIAQGVVGVLVGRSSNNQNAAQWQRTYVGRDTLRMIESMYTLDEGDDNIFSLRGELRENVERI
jgi:hypothetical protein